MSVFRLLLFVAAGLVLLLSGCRSLAIGPRFAAGPGYSHPPSSRRVDTVTVLTARHPPTPPPQAKADSRSREAGTRNSGRKQKTKPAGEPGSRFAEATTGDTTRNAAHRVARPSPRDYASSKLSSAQTLVHYGLHFVFPVVLALLFFPLLWQTAYLVMLATMAIDLDHLLAKPIFDPLRCSVGYHPLHSFYAVPVYVLLLLLPATQIVAVGLLFHLFTDTVDCLWNFSHCQQCYVNSRIYALRNWVRKLWLPEGAR